MPPPAGGFRALRALRRPGGLVEFFFAGVEFVVATLLSKELVVAASLDYLALFKHHNGVGIADGGETVRYTPISLRSCINLNMFD